VKEGIAPRAGSGIRGQFSLPNLIALGQKASEVSEKAAAAAGDEDENEELSMAIKLRHNAHQPVKEDESSDEEVEEETANNGSDSSNSLFRF